MTASVRLEHDKRRQEEKLTITFLNGAMGINS
jgi:hypothetical protein